MRRSGADGTVAGRRGGFGAIGCGRGRNVRPLSGSVLLRQDDLSLAAALAAHVEQDRERASEELDFERAAALTIIYGTAYHALALERRIDLDGWTTLVLTRRMRALRSIARIRKDP